MSEMPQPETGEYSVFEMWVGRGVAGCGLLLFVAGSALFVLAGFTFGWRTLPVALVYGGIPSTECLIVAGLLVAKRVTRAVIAVWLCNLLYVFLIFNGALGL